MITIVLSGLNWIPYSSPYWLHSSICCCSPLAVLETRVMSSAYWIISIFSTPILIPTLSSLIQLAYSSPYSFFLKPNCFSLVLHCFLLIATTFSNIVSDTFDTVTGLRLDLFVDGFLMSFIRGLMTEMLKSHSTVDD